MNDKALDEQILEAIRSGSSTRERLMAIENLRHRTWAVIAQRLAILVKSGALVASKSGWRIS